MIAFKNTDELNKVIRQQLILQSGLESKYVRNSLTAYGLDLNKQKFDEYFASITHDDTLLLFELSLIDDNMQMSETTNESVQTTATYNMHLICYGDCSADIMQRLVSRFRTAAVRQKLYDDGVYVQDVSNSTSINDFINDTIWYRTDCDLILQCYFNYTEVEVEDIILINSNINIKEI